MDRIGSTMQKKAAELERLAEVLVTGEQLRCVQELCLMDADPCMSLDQEDMTGRDAHK